MMSQRAKSQNCMFKIFTEELKNKKPKATVFHSSGFQRHKNICRVSPVIHSDLLIFFKY